MQCAHVCWCFRVFYCTHHPGNGARGKGGLQKCHFFAFLPFCPLPFAFEVAGILTGYVVLETFLFLVGWSRQWGAVRVGEERDVLDEEVPEEVVPIAFKKSVEMRHSPLVGSRCLALRSIVVRMEAYATDGKRNSVGQVR